MRSSLLDNDMNCIDAFFTHSVVTAAKPGCRAAKAPCWRTAAAAAAVAMVLGGCGGGGELRADVAPGPVIGLQVGVVTGTTSYAPALPGEVLDVFGRVGQAFEFDASEPVRWRFSVNGSPLFDNGTIVDLGGVTLAQTQVSPSRVVLDSALYGPALVPIGVVLTATSTIDNAQVATVRLSLQ